MPRIASGRDDRQIDVGGPQPCYRVAEERCADTRAKAVLPRQHES